MEQFIIFGKNHYQYNGFDINKFVYHDALVQDNVLYIEPKDSAWIRYLDFFYKNEYGIAFRKKLFLPFRRLAYKAFLRKSSKIKMDKDNIFLFFYAYPWFFEDKGFLEFLRKKYRRSKLVYHFTNILDKVYYGLEHYKKYFDLVSTCDKGDSEKYGIPFFADGCSYVEFSDNREEKSECFFVGQAKNRLDDLLTIYESLTDRGVKCEFYITGVKEEDKRFAEAIHYNQPLNYDVILKKVSRTNVLLELLQDGMDTHTLRYPEAVLYGKKLVTNYSDVAEEESYSPKNIRKITSAEDVALIDKAFFTSPAEEAYPNRASVSSSRFLPFITEHLTESSRG